MSYISKYLESLMTKKDKVTNSQTTNSVYYNIGKLKIGISDHFPEAAKITCDIRIVNPLNAKTVYLVQVKEGPQILTFNLAGLKTFISNYLYIREIKELKKEVISNVAKANKVVKAQNAVKCSRKISKAESGLTCNYTNETEWVSFWAVVNSTFPNYKKFMTSKKRTVIYKACKGQTVDVVIEKLKDAINAGALYAGSSSLDLKKYLETK